jgi:NADH-quinone oxidoreductase subunit J
LAEILFYVLALGAIGCGVGVVAARMPLFSVLSLLGSFFCLSGIYLLAGFQFLAATQLLVYAGAIMVLFLFVIMLLNLGDEAELKRHAGRSLPRGKLVIAGLTAGALGLVGLISAGWGEVYAADPALTAAGVDDLGSLADVLFSRYMLPFEAASILLLATMIAVIALAKRQRTDVAARGDRESLGWPFNKGIEQ